MKALHFTCQGESHKATNKVCQDYSYSEVSERMTIAIVCDGHGGARYFRSDVGAKYATEITKDCVTTFIEGVGDELFKGKTFTQVYALNTEIKNDNFAKKTKIDNALRQLFSSIIYRWQDKILNHAKTNPLTDNEKTSLDTRYVSDFEAQKSLEKTYGCTLMCYAQTKDYWFAFHLGDGKCIAFDKDGNWSEPIPWDERCFLNKTTSLCDSSALDEFRYCYQGDGEFPVAVFLGSDGIDDSFGETTNMVNFYAQVAKMLAKDSLEDSMTSLQTALPELSAKGSQDDMSIACVFDDLRIGELVGNLIAWQQRNAHQAIVASNQRIEQLRNKYNQFEGKKNLSRSEQIDLHYTVTELKRSYQNKREQAKKYDRFSKESGGDFEPYNDELGFGEQFVLLAEQKLEEQVIDSNDSEETANVETNVIDKDNINEIDESLPEADVISDSEIKSDEDSEMINSENEKTDDIELTEDVVEITNAVNIDELSEEIMPVNEPINTEIQETETEPETENLKKEEDDE